jgi:hypothetical protein
MGHTEASGSAGTRELGIAMRTVRSPEYYDDCQC